MKRRISNRKAKQQKWCRPNY